MQQLKVQPDLSNSESGVYVTMNQERWYQITDSDHLPPFFITLASGADHWLFISSTGGLTAGRRAPEDALFPYLPVDRIHESHPHTGPVNHFKVRVGSEHQLWSPLFHGRAWKGHCTRNLYKSVNGTKICFEEIHHTLQLSYRLIISTSEEYGFVVSSDIINLGRQDISFDLLSGLQNILPANTPRPIQETSSNLVDAYKRSELDPRTNLGLFTLYSAISDRAQANESLRANTAFLVGLDNPQVTLDPRHIETFLLDQTLTPQESARGIRGAFLVTTEMTLAPREIARWAIVANVQQSQLDIAKLQATLLAKANLWETIAQDVTDTEQKLVELVAGADGLQRTQHEAVSVHHYANTLFNIMRGGTFVDGGMIRKQDFLSSINQFDRQLEPAAEQALTSLPDTFELTTLTQTLGHQNNPQLNRLAQEYLPISFGRRHGDPSRPWNHFDINLTDANGNRRLAYEGNWRDIFQNWEALSLSFPVFVENMIAKFVNASTLDGYNPYRITDAGIDWEIEDPEDPWSYIGYWGDHQIIYLLKFLEQSHAVHPGELANLLLKPQFAYANVPYKVRSFDELTDDPKNTVVFDEAAASLIQARVDARGSDGKLLLDETGQVYLVTLLEKLLVPLLSKLSNFVVDGGIWLNTQRPEWNDGNNALVGYGVSAVTLCYLRRYTRFLKSLIEACPESIALTQAVGKHLIASRDALLVIAKDRKAGLFDSHQRWNALKALGQAGSDYRSEIYASPVLATATLNRQDISTLLDTAVELFDLTIAANQREDGLFHTYNLLKLEPESASLVRLYPMLEGQVAALSAKALTSEQSVAVLKALFASDIYRPDAGTFMLYPDRALTGFMEKNILSEATASATSLYHDMLAAGDYRLVGRDHNGHLRFHPDCTNTDALASILSQVLPDYPAHDHVDAQQAVEAAYEEVFNHLAFTGRSGGMFGFEGLGCVYWHMVGKLLLAVQETLFDAVDAKASAETTDALRNYYYQIHEGLGFNQTPEDFGAIPFDPYSHTPGHAGAQQPGMTGQVKEEILARYGELGLRIENGVVVFSPHLLRIREFTQAASTFKYLDLQGAWQERSLPEASLAFTWCQIPIVYKIVPEGFSITVHDTDTSFLIHGDALTAEQTDSIMSREGRITALEVSIARAQLWDE